jgi:PST family polysaccharide transporter
MGYTKQTIAGFTWHTALIVGITIVTGLKLMVLARLLMPHDFGLYSLVVIVLGLTEALTQTGINITIIQSKQSIDYFINTAWVISIARGFCIAILMSIAGVGMAYLYAEPSLQFFRDSVYRFSLVVVEALVTCAVAVFTQSVTAFIAGIIVSAIFEVTISFLFLRTRPRFEWIPNRATQIFANAKGLSLAAVLSYLQDNADNFLIGKLLGVSTLGLYQNGYALSHKPVFGVSQAMSHSTMPIFSRLAGSGERLQRAFYRATFGLTALLFCIALPTLFFPEFIIKLLLGENWLGLVPAVPWLVAGAVLAGVANQGYTLLVSLKEYFTMNLHRALVISVFIILLFAQGAAAGLVGAAMAVFFARLLCLPFLGWYVIKKLRV